MKKLFFLIFILLLLVFVTPVQSIEPDTFRSVVKITSPTTDIKTSKNVSAFMVGTGFIVDRIGKDLYILTCSHNYKKDHPIAVTLYYPTKTYIATSLFKSKIPGEGFPPNIVAMNGKYKVVDVALLKITVDPDLQYRPIKLAIPPGKHVTYLMWGVGCPKGGRPTAVLCHSVNLFSPMNYWGSLEFRPSPMQGRSGGPLIGPCESSYGMIEFKTDPAWEDFNELYHGGGPTSLRIWSTIPENLRHHLHWDEGSLSAWLLRNWMFYTYSI